MRLHLDNIFFLHGIVQATIYWEHEGTHFPEITWIDNAAILLGWWLGVTIELAAGEPESKFVFMEGPFAIPLRRIGQADIEVQLGALTEVVPLSLVAEQVLYGSRKIREFGTTNAESGINVEGFLRAEEVLRFSLTRGNY